MVALIFCDFFTEKSPLICLFDSGKKKRNLLVSKGIIGTVKRETDSLAIPFRKTLLTAWERDIDMDKRLSTLFLSLLAIPCCLFLASQQWVLADQVQILNQIEMGMTFADLESLEAEFHQANSLVTVKGRIKNTSDIVIRGFLSLHLLSSTGSVLESFELPLKSHQPINRGESVEFETVLPLTRSKGATQVSVDFTKN